MFASLMENLLSSDAQFIILGAIFIAVFGLCFFFIRLVLPVFSRRRAVRGAETDDKTGRMISKISAHIGDDEELLERIEVYYRSLDNPDQNSLQRRLVNAGYLNQHSMTYFMIIRVTAAMVLFIGTFVLTTQFSPESQFVTLFFLAFIAGALGLFVPNFILDNMGTKQKTKYQRSFPDFMDMMIVCTDAGLSIEAAATRVAKEFLSTERLLGVHLSIMMLEVRAGTRFREALSNFADRLEIPEAKSLAVLFRQSEELGSSLTQALRVYSSEMRQLRMLRAEEKANALPVKLVLPLAAFLFPVTMVIVVVPVMITLLTALGMVGGGF